MDHLHGETMVIEAKLFLPGSNPNFGTWLKDAMKLKFDGGSITTTHLGLAYINFGYAGAMLFPFLSVFYFNPFIILSLKHLPIQNFGSFLFLCCHFIWEVL